MRCLDKNMNTRPTIRELMADPWLAEGERQLVPNNLTAEAQRKRFCTRAATSGEL